MEKFQKLWYSDTRGAVCSKKTKFEFFWGLRKISRRPYAVKYSKFEFILELRKIFALGRAISCGKNSAVLQSFIWVLLLHAGKQHTSYFYYIGLCEERRRKNSVCWCSLVVVLRCCVGLQYSLCSGAGAATECCCYTLLLPTALVT